jgi:hypothetical protein
MNKHNSSRLPIHFKLKSLNIIFLKEREAELAGSAEAYT